MIKRLLAGFIVGLAIVAGLVAINTPKDQWSATEIKKIQSLWIGSLPPLPPDPSDRVADDLEAAAFGRKIFFDSRFSANGYVSCATCHRPDQGFQDGLPQAKGVGLTMRRTQSLVGVAYGPWYFWDGRKDSLWAQALSPLEGVNEHGGNRFQYARLINDFYAKDYESLFGPLPNIDWTGSYEALGPNQQKQVTLVFVNIGKVLEAYERTLLPQPTRFDRYAEAVLHNAEAADTLFNADEMAGLKLFMGKANCTTCHNGPMFTDHDFHNTGVPAIVGQTPDPGWVVGLPQMLDDEFGCKGPWSDAGPAGGCVDRRYLIVGMANQPGAFKTPSLRNVAQQGPYMHAGQFGTLQQVLVHYNSAPVAPLGKTELKPLQLTETELRQLIAFLNTLSDVKN